MEVIMKKLKYLTRINRLTTLSEKEQKELQRVTDKFAFRTNTYYLNMINWDDPEDPIRRIIIPSRNELDSWGKLDASEEAKYTQVSGLQHKYQYTALLLVNDVCGSYCRFCFRKRIFMHIRDEIVRDVTPGIEYIKQHKEISNVLLTGGDPLVLSTNKLRHIIRELRKIDHVHIVRIGTKMLSFNPYRVIEDNEFIQMLNEYSTDEKKIYIMAHYNHPRELTKQSIKAINMILKTGSIIVNQTPLLRGINDDPETLGDLFNKLSYIGVSPYYVFQCRPTLGNKMFSVPIEEAFDIFEQARMKGSGLAKRAKYVMSHSSGKIEVIGKSAHHIFFRYHRAAHFADKAKLMIFNRNPNAYWFDDYSEPLDTYSLENPYLN